jgi:glutathione S-transferase
VYFLLHCEILNATFLDDRQGIPGEAGRKTAAAAVPAPCNRGLGGETRMTQAILTISSKNYSSWSMRGWLLCKMAQLDFVEDLRSSADPSTRANANDGVL